MLLRRALLGLGLIFVCWSGARAQRLPGGVRPEHYSLVITPDLAKARFAGEETIEVVLDKPAKAITLNAAEIEFGAVKAERGGGPEANAGILPLRQAQGQNDSNKANDKPTEGGGLDATVSLDATREQATLTFARELPSGRVTLEIAYTGILNDKLRGFYLSKTKLRSYGVTQFEATDARRAFPCFDEPAMKATFDVSLVIDAGDTAISNTKMVSDKPGPAAGKHTVAFATTPKMSTYLLAWLVGDFKCVKGKSQGVEIRACATPDKVGLTKFALDAAKWDIRYYDKYFGIKYPLKKLDMVAVPDFEAGAMENFGCITYRETEMLVDRKDGALEAKKEVATTVAHEISHQWFGDLVTPQWWDDLWLNEGFATWMETKATAEWQPKWELDQDLAVDENHTLDADADRTTRAVRTRAETPAEINEAFDDIAYGKAGAVIAMVENWVGAEVFRKGIQAYLAAHLYGNAKGEDFWNTEARVSGQPVDKVMQSFVEQPGVPEILLTAEGASVPVPQRRLFLSEPDSLSEPDAGGDARLKLTNLAWTIQVCFKGASCQILTPPGTTIDVPVPVFSGGLSQGMQFMYANAGDKGYYRTAYVPAMLKTIETDAETGLTAPERIGLLGNQWALMRAGQGTVGEFLDLVLAVKQDPSATVLDTALGRVGTIDAEIASEDDRERLAAVVRREFGGVYAALGGPVKHEAYDHVQLRETLFEELGRAKDPAVLAEADSLTKQLFAAQKPSDPMIADAAMALATAHGDEEMYERLQKVGRNATDPDVKEAVLHALTRFQSPLLVIRTLEYAVSDEVRSQDSWMLIALLLERRETQDLAWEFVEQHWDAIARKSTLNSGARIVEAAGAFCTVERRDEVTDFFAEHRVESSQRTLKKSVDRMNDCIHLRAAQEPELRRWLDAHGGS